MSSVVISILIMKYRLGSNARAISNNIVKIWCKPGVLHDYISDEEVDDSPANDDVTDRAESLYAEANQYRKGVDVYKDIDVAIAFYKEAAELDHSGAQIALSYLLLGNEGAPALEWEAFHWAALAANNGEPTGFFNLGIMYRYGLGTEINYQKALEAFKKYISIQSGLVDLGTCQYEIGLIYKDGLGVDTDYMVALSWLRKAKKNCYEDAAADITEITDLLQSKRNSNRYQDNSRNKKNKEKQKPNKSRILSCPVCSANLRVPIPIPSGNARCKKCGGKFNIKEDSHDNLHISIVGDNVNSDDDLPKTCKEACAVLGLSINATLAEIKLSYKRLMKEYHPDKVESLGEKLKVIAVLQSKKINAAYEILK